MTRRVIRTTRRVQVNGEDEPVETVHEREVERVLRNGNDLQVYETDDRTSPDYYVPAEPAVRATREELTVLNSWLQTLQNLTQRQLAILRDFDLRVTRLEELNRLRSPTPSVERATWWALWGILMLILGAALVVILFLIFSSTLH